MNEKHETEILTFGEIPCGEMFKSEDIGKPAVKLYRKDYNGWNYACFIENDRLTVVEAPDNMKVETIELATLNR